MRFAFVGGGTGGHFYPLMAVAETLNRSAAQPELLYIGPEPYDASELKLYNIQFVYCPAGKLRRYASIQNFFDVFRNFFGFFVAICKLYVYYPDVIFSKGGYTSVPVLFAARILRIPVVIHESDSVPGRANLLMKSYARYIAIAYAEAALFLPPKKTALVGIPMRPELREIPERPHEQLGIPQDVPLIYVTGGSLGAQNINNLILRSLGELLPHYRIFHQTGGKNLDELRLTAQSLITDPTLQDRYYLEGSVNAATVSLLLSAAALVITRAGSTTLFEIAHHNKPAIIIPISEDVSRDQRSNAYAVARHGGALVLEEANLTSHLLVQEIRTILDDPVRYETMRKAAESMFVPDASAKIAQILISIGTEHGS